MSVVAAVWIENIGEADGSRARARRVGAQGGSHRSSPACLELAVVYALGAGAVVDQQVLFGSDPAAAILDVAAVNVDLLVLGSRAYGPVRRALANSVSSGAVRHAPCPVLLTPRLSDGAG